LARLKRSSSTNRHSHPYAGLPPDQFEHLVYRLTQRSGEFDAVQWYRSAREDGRDVVAHKDTSAGRERWYIQCKLHKRISYATLRDALDGLAEHAANLPTFAPHVIVFATACDVPPLLQNKARIYARALGLPEPRYWGRSKLDHMLQAQPETEEEFFDQQPRPAPRDEPGLTRSAIGWGIGIALCAILLVVGGMFFGLPQSLPEETLTATSTPTRPPRPTQTRAPTSTSTVTPSPTPQPTNTPTPTPTSTPTFTPTPSPTPTPTPTRTPTPLPEEPSLLAPAAGTTVRAAVFRWQGELRPGQSFVVHLQHLASGRTQQSEELTTTCWEAQLPAERFGGWEWQVWVVRGSTGLTTREERVLAQSETRAFWFDPFPSVPLPVSPPCGE